MSQNPPPTAMGHSFARAQRDDGSPEQSNGAPSPLPAALPGGEVRVSVLMGDRMCITCGYNLTGQPVLREPHYDMLIVRCPECATVASIQEYPLLGRWSSRWVAVLAAVWFLFLVVFWVGSGAAIFGIAVGAAELGADKYTSFLNQKWSAWQVQQAAANASATQPAAPVFARGVNDFYSWYDTQDKAALFAEAGGRWGSIEWMSLFYLAPAILASFVLGVFWATFLLGRSKTGLALWSLAIMAVSVGFSILVLVEWYTADHRGWWSGYHTSMRELGAMLLFGALVVQAGALVAGLMSGRPIVRWLLCVLLPPRLRSPLAFVWLADGLDPPSTRTSSARRG